MVSLERAGETRPWRSVWSGLANATDQFPSSVSVRVVGATLACPVLVALLVSPVPEDRAAVAAVKVVFATVVVAVVPGTLLLLALRPLAGMSVLQALGLGIAVGFALVQALTMISLTLHLSIATLGVAMLVISGLLLAVVWIRAAPRAALRLEKEELFIAVLLAILAVPLYLKGSPIATGEDLIHIAVIRRLAFVPFPALDNIYYSPGLLYTYPFPGTHFLFALVSRLGNVDPLLVYDKTRFFWGPAAVLFVYLGARLAFNARGIAFTAALAGVLFALGGAFADVSSYSWAQLAPFSHASDVAMNVLLPGAIVLTLSFLVTQARGASLTLGLSALSLVLMLAIVHIREAVQYVVYLVAFLLVAVISRRGRSQVIRTASLLAVTIAIILLYVTWHKFSVGHIDEVVEARRAILIDHALHLPPADWIRAPFLDPYFSVGMEAFFYGWFPIIILASPIVVYLLRSHPFALAFGGCVFLYLLIVRFTFFSIPYIFATYYEILFTPVRNVVFFVYVLTGALFYLVALGIARVKWHALGVLLVVSVLFGLHLVWDHVGSLYQALTARGGRIWEPGLDVLFLGAAALYVVVFALSSARYNSNWWRRLPQAQQPRAWVPIMLVLVLGAAVVTAVPESSPLLATRNSIGGLSLSGSWAHTTRPLVDTFECIDTPTIALPLGPIADRFKDVPVEPPPTSQACVPDYELITWSRDHLRADAVLAIDTFNRYSPAPFVAQQIDAWPVADSAGLFWDQLFPRYFEAFQRSLTRYHVQPMFNSVETLDERLAFARDLAVTHVLVDPMYHPLMQTTLEQWPDHFHQIYDDGAWAVYEVVGN